MASEHPKKVPTQVTKRRIAFGTMRLLLLTAAFLIIAINPLTNRYLQVNFVQGWYQSLGIGKLWFVSPLEGLESLLIGKTIYLPSLIGMVLPLLLAFFLGRVFCSWLCPVSFFLELTERLRRRLTGKQHLKNRLIVAKRTLWFVLIGEVVLSMILGAPLFVFLSPPGLIGRELMMLVFFHKLALEGLVLLVILFLELFTRRAFCRSFCPLGGLLALVGSKRKVTIRPITGKCTDCGRCRQSCPMGLDPTAGDTIGPYCWNCGECVDSCRFGAVDFFWTPRGTLPPGNTPAMK